MTPKPSDSMSERARELAQICQGKRSPVEAERAFYDAETERLTKLILPTLTDAFNLGQAGAARDSKGAEMSQTPREERMAQAAEKVIAQWWGGNPTIYST